MRGIVGYSVILVLTLGAAAHASQVKYITCTIDRTWDESTGAITLTTGTDTFVIETEANGSDTYTFPQKCTENTASFKIDEKSIWMTCDQRIDNMVFARFFKIDRISGEYQSGFGLKGKAALVHIGQCQSAQPKF